MNSNAGKNLLKKFLKKLGGEIGDKTQTPYEVLEITNTSASNDDIKRVVKKYFTNDNRKTVVISMNDDKKSWYTPIVSFVENQFVLRLWDPEK